MFHHFSSLILVSLFVIIFQTQVQARFVNGSYFCADTIPADYLTEKQVDVLPLLLECDKLALSERERYFCSRIKLKDLIEKTLNYPQEARHTGIEGTVNVQFIVAPDGTMQNVSVQRDIGHGCGEAALEAIAKIPDQDVRWSPGLVQDSAVHTIMYVPVRFDLEAYALKNTDSATKRSPKPKTKSSSKPESGYSGPEIFKVVEQMPRFPGCEDEDLTNKEKESCGKEKMLEYIYGNLIYPEEAWNEGIEGMVVMQFVVSAKGVIKDVNIVRDIGGGCGAEAQRIIESMNHMEESWVPGHQRGRPVMVLYTLPVKFRLDDYRGSRRRKRLKMIK